MQNYRIESIMAGFQSFSVQNNANIFKCEESQKVPVECYTTTKD